LTGRIEYLSSHAWVINYW